MSSPAPVPSSLLFTTASTWEEDTVTEEAREALKKFVTELAGYPCKLACKTNDDIVDIYVFSIEKKKVIDWIELQSNGAVGVIFDLYADSDNRRAQRLELACTTYNKKHGLEFIEEDDESSATFSSTSDDE